MVKTKEQKIAQSIRQMGGKLSDETKAKISNSNKGKFVSIETRLKMSIGGKGKKMSEFNKMKLSESNKGIPKLPFYSLLFNKKTYDKANLSRYYPEFKPYM